MYSICTCRQAWYSVLSPEPDERGDVFADASLTERAYEPPPLQLGKANRSTCSCNDLPRSFCLFGCLIVSG